MKRAVENKADMFLRMIRQAQRGRLKIYLGYAAGVGKTYQMLLEGRRLKEEGIDVVVGLAETHGRVETEKLLDGLEIVPRRQEGYRGIVVKEMDVDAVLKRKPQVALIDELAHTNVPGSRNDKRYQDVQDILAAGIHVITTLNIQHLESLYDTVEKAVGVRVRERLPDRVIVDADQIVNVDVSTEDLRERLQEGKVYTTERIDVALDHFFKASNLERLRELTLRELASQIDLRRRETFEEEESQAPDQVMVCLSSEGPDSDKLLRYASRLAGRLNRTWYAVYVQTPAEEPTLVDAKTQGIIASTLTLAKQLGAIVFTYKGEDVVATLLQFAKEYRVGHIVIGSPGPTSFWKKLRRRTGVVESLIRQARGTTITVLDTRKERFPNVEAFGNHDRQPVSNSSRPETSVQLRLSGLLSPEQIIIWNKPVAKEDALRRLAEAAGQEVTQSDPARILNAVLERERQGSTFFNEGAAFPHARIDALAASVVSLGLTRQGVSDELTEKPIELVFLILSPAQNPEEQVKILALASRAAQSRHFLQYLTPCRSPKEAMEAIRNWDRREDESKRESGHGQ
jgi:two-component system sensor histidine kinase KdpD